MHSHRHECLQATQLRELQRLVGPNLRQIEAPADAVDLLSTLLPLVNVALECEARRAPQRLSVLPLHQLPNLRHLYVFTLGTVPLKSSAWRS